MNPNPIIKKPNYLNMNPNPTTLEPKKSKGT